VPLFDEKIAAAVGNTFEKPYDLLLGRRTYDIFAAHWPHVQKDRSAKDYDAGTAHMGRAFDAATKFVATHHPDTLKWQNSKALGADIAASVRDLKQTDGPDLVVQGSSELVRQLLTADIVDHLHLITFPVILGHGKRLFGDNAAPGGFKLEKTIVSDSGVIAAWYTRAGEVKTGAFAFDNPSKK
jgi:dihydrofolate reductase